MSFSPEQLRTVSWSCVHFANEVPPLAEFEISGVEVFEIDAEPIHDKGELLAAIAASMRFPDYFGGNWDALDESLRDLSWLGGSGYALIVRDAGHLWRDHHRVAANLIESWLLCAGHWAAREVPFNIVFEW